jgi:hypothetical protein
MKNLRKQNNESNSQRPSPLSSPSQPKNKKKVGTLPSFFTCALKATTQNKIK